MKKDREAFQKFQEKKARELKRKEKKKRRKGQKGGDGDTTDSFGTDDEFQTASAQHEKEDTESQISKQD